MEQSITFLQPHILLVCLHIEASLAAGKVAFNLGKKNLVPVLLEKI